MNFVDFFVILIMKRAGPKSNLAKALAELQATPEAYGLISKVARSHSVNRSTLNRAWIKLRDLTSGDSAENNARLINRAARVVEPRGATTHRLLTDQEEEFVIQQLRSKHPHGFTDKILKQICIESARKLRNRPRHWSRSFFTGFKRRAGIRSAKFVARKRNIEDPEATFAEDVEAASFYLEDVKKLAESIPIELIINVDETPSYVRNAPSKALHFIDAEGPWAWTRTQEREKVTVIAACTGEGEMLKSGVIAKGTTTRCEAEYVRQIGDLAFVQHTKSGLTNTHSFIEYIKGVIEPYVAGREAVLIVDSWGAHLTQPVRNHCASVNIHLVQVPERGTSKCACRVMYRVNIQCAQLQLPLGTERSLVVRLV